MAEEHSSKALIAVVVLYSWARFISVIFQHLHNQNIIHGWTNGPWTLYIALLSFPLFQCNVTCFSLLLCLCPYPLHPCMCIMATVSTSTVPPAFLSSLHVSPTLAPLSLLPSTCCPPLSHPPLHPPFLHPLPPSLHPSPSLSLPSVTPSLHLSPPPSFPPSSLPPSLHVAYSYPFFPYLSMYCYFFPSYPKRMRESFNLDCHLLLSIHFAYWILIWLFCPVCVIL